MKLTALIGKLQSINSMRIGKEPDVVLAFRNPEGKKLAANDFSVVYLFREELVILDLPSEMTDSTPV